MGAYKAGKKTAGDAVHIIQDHIHGSSCVYPTLAVGTTVTGHATAWTLGAAFQEVIPASTIGSPFDIHHIDVEGISADGTYELVLYAVETEIGRVRASFSGIANSIALASVPFQCKIQDADTQIQAKVASSSGGEDTITISLHYHTY